MYLISRFLVVASYLSDIDRSEVINQILIVAIPLLITGFGSVITWLVNKFVKNSTVKNYLSQLSDTVTSVTLEVYQTYVEALKKSGTFTKENQEEALSSALAKLKTLLPTAVITYLQTLYSDLDSYLTTLIESEIAKHKTSIQTSTTSDIEGVLIEKVETETSAYEELSDQEESQATNQVDLFEESEQTNIVAEESTTGDQTINE